MWRPFQGKGYELGGGEVLLTPPLMKERRADKLEMKKMERELQEKREKEKMRRKMEMDLDDNNITTTKVARKLNYT
jgi:hypothetical protein